MVFSQVKKQLEQQNYRGQEGSKEPSSSSYSELDIVVHPGFSMINYEDEDSVFDWLDKTRFGVNSDFSSRDSYEEYLSSLGEELRKTENPVVFLYDDSQIDQYQEFVEEKIGIQTDSDHTYFLQTELDSGHIEAVEEWELSGLIHQLEENGEVNIHGEQNGRCTDESLESLKQVGEALNKDSSFRYGEVFPRVRL
ncbi:MAG: hypothetical protein ACI9LV_000576 [Candidatus Nanohaloarchaea archaeon]|jgi:hypothetical protein